MAPDRIPESFWNKIEHGIFGRARDLHDPNLVKDISLVAFLAWVGLGVDGLSSSAYGPDAAFRALGQHAYLAVFLAIATAITVVIISFTYTKVIEHFPYGGGGYLVATHMLGKTPGVISGSALLVDYVLTITVSIAGGGDALFSLLPLEYQPYKLSVEFFAIGLLIIMNLRGLRESIQFILPLFLIFIVTHAILIFGGVFVHLGDLPTLASDTTTGFALGVREIGLSGVLMLFLRAYSLGGGTYTGIEAVSNGLASLREPRVATAKRTMAYLAISLSITAGGLLLCYMLFHVVPTPGKTLNAVLVDSFAGHWQAFNIPFGYWFVLITIFSESILLLIAAQTGFIGGPRVMANMAIDSWLPRRFTHLSDRLTLRSGIFVVGISALGLLAYTRGHIEILVIMYSINVFITFSLTQLSMMRFWKDSKGFAWKRNFLLHTVGFILCFSILTVMILEKLLEGAWATLVITGACVMLCALIRRHYREIGTRIKHIEHRVREVVRSPGLDAVSVPEFDPTKPTAGILVGGYSKLGRRSLLAVLKSFPKTFHNVVFISVGAINSEFFKQGLHLLEERTEEVLKGYVSIANRSGLPARYVFRVGTDVVREASELCLQLSQTYGHVVFFAGELIFERPKFWDKILHNETAYAIQRQIRHFGLPMVILPLVLHEGSEHHEIPMKEGK